MLVRTVDYKFVDRRLVQVVWSISDWWLCDVEYSVAVMHAVDLFVIFLSDG